MYTGIVNYMPDDSNHWESESCGNDNFSLYDARKQAILKAIELCQNQ